nr:NAD(+)--dinitrogen-reductase ADP-D-ribosyltransferase [uncultured Desulfuromonas sp.]
MSYRSFNFCDQPPWVIASHEFNNHPQPLKIQGVWRNNRFLFDKLEQTACAPERARLFQDYMSVKFQLHHWQQQNSDRARDSIRNSYLHFLKGWMIDSNSISGAVFKHWVESRFGLHPTFHRERIDGISSEAYFRFMIDVTQGRSCTNALSSQFDLLYEFTQHELHCRFPDQDCLTLYRGTHDAEEYEIVRSFGKWDQIVRLNNLVSFTCEQERAWEFGRTVWKTSVPLAKIFFFYDLLPGSILRGEDEYMAIGGEYQVQRLLY